MAFISVFICCGTNVILIVKYVYTSLSKRGQVNQYVCLMNFESLNGREEREVNWVAHFVLRLTF